MTQVTDRPVSTPRGGVPGRMWTIFGIVLIAVLVLAWWSSGLFGGDTTTESDEFVVAESIDRIVVRSDAGNITVTGTELTETSYRQTVNAARSQPEITRAVNGATLTLEADCPFLSTNCSVDFDITAPRDVVVDLQTSAGNVILESLAGDVKAETSAGNVILEAVAGRVDVRTSAGNVEGSRLESTTMDASSSAGNVQLRFDVAIEDLEARTSAGNVFIEVPGGPYDVDADSSIGDVTIEVPTDSSASARIVADTSAGEVMIRSK